MKGRMNSIIIGVPQNRATGKRWSVDGQQRSSFDMEEIAAMLKERQIDVLLIQGTHTIRRTPANTSCSVQDIRDSILVAILNKLVHQWNHNTDYLSRVGFAPITSDFDDRAIKDGAGNERSDLKELQAKIRSAN